MRFCEDASCSPESEVESGPTKLSDLVFTCVLARPMNVLASDGSRVGSMNDAQSFLFRNNSLFRLISMPAISILQCATSIKPGIRLKMEQMTLVHPKSNAPQYGSTGFRQCDRRSALPPQRGAEARLGGADPFMEESIGTLMRPFSHASQNGLDQLTESRKTVATSLRLHAKRS